MNPPTLDEVRHAWADALRAAELADRLAGDAAAALRDASLAPDDANGLIGLVLETEEASARAMVRAHGAVVRLESTPDERGS